MNGTPDWLRPDPHDTNVFVWHFVPPRIEPFEPLRMQRYDTPPIGDGQQAPIATTDSIHSRGDALLHLMTFECESRAAARAQLLHVLGGFQGPVLERSDVAGEVAFAAPGEISVAVRQPQNFAEKFDIKPQLTVRRAVAAPLDLPAEDVFVLVIARGGEVHLVDSRPVFTAPDPGRAYLSIFAGTARAQIDVNVE